MERPLDQWTLRGEQQPIGRERAGLSCQAGANDIRHGERGTAEGLIDRY